ncbi:transporter substrate-binding domain-containing protein [Shewanella maritima]|uniref:Transporter substrate-binding domain-containing protein n=1 Tax=Shewanella maritima TaxID=2520507 RepID=A0A411PI29_9GAMM|nr:transporter substrate-binding domain-containing protein [Shewanella maritima]QBF83104.1 transporter substrate-binding domain-containing protein [Shewanella maritima]
MTTYARIPPNLLTRLGSYCLTAITAILLTITLVSTTQATQIDRIITISTQEWPPYQMQTGNDQTGAAIDALACVMRRLQQPYKVIFLPWGRAQFAVEQGKYDGFFSAAKNDQRDSYAVFSEPFIAQTWNYYLLKGTQVPLDPQTIKQQAYFGSRKHSNTTYWLKQNDFQLIHQADHINELLALLQKGRIDAMMENKLLFEDAIAKAGLPMEMFEVVHNRTLPLGVYFGNQFVKRYPEFVEQFNRHTHACRFEETPTMATGKTTSN